MQPFAFFVAKGSCVLFYLKTHRDELFLSVFYWGEGGGGYDMGGDVFGPQYTAAHATDGLRFCASYFEEKHKHIKVSKLKNEM